MSLTRDWISPVKFSLLIGERSDLPGESGWIPPVLFVVLVTMAVQMALTPLTASLLHTLPSAADLTPEQRLHAVEVFRKSRYLSIGLMPVSIPARLLVATWVTYMLAVLLNVTVTFRRLFMAFAVAALGPALWNAVIAAAVLWNGGVESIAGLTPPTGLTLLYEPESRVLHAVLASVSIVLVWQFAVLVTYVKRETNARMWKVFALTLPVGLVFPMCFDLISNLVAS